MLQGIENIALATPALTALTIQIWVLAHSDKRQLLKKNWPILLFFIGVSGLTFIEFGTYAGMFRPSVISMKLFYVFCSITFTGILVYSMKISGVKFFQEPNSKILALVLCVMFSFLISFTDAIIKDIIPIGYSVTREPGRYYYIAQIYGGGLISLTIFCLSTGAKVSDNIVKKQARVLLYSTTPFMFIFLSLLILMALGIKINASVIIPLATTYMLLVLIITEHKENLFSLLLKIPYTHERKSYKEITTQIENFLSQTNSGQQVSLKTLTTNIEQQIVSMAVQMANGSQIKAASLLNVSASSICRKKAEKVRRVA